MKNDNQGQILPFCMILMSVLLWIIISNFEVGFLNLRKIQVQKKLDGTALDYGTTYARALNGLAATNEGLKIAAQRGYMMTVIAAALAASAQIPYSPTKVWWKMLKPKLPRFYKRLNKLGESLAKQQEQIISWMVQTRCLSEQTYKLEFNSFYMYPHFPCSFHGDFEGLPFYRPGDSLSHHLPLAFNIPAPLVFKNEFFEEKNRFIFLVSEKIKSPFHKIHLDSSHHSSGTVWSLTEIKIEGHDFQKMEFVPRLSPVSLENKLWRGIQANNPINNIPSLEVVSREIAH